MTALFKTDPEGFNLTTFKAGDQEQIDFVRAKEYSAILSFAMNIVFAEKTIAENSGKIKEVEDIVEAAFNRLTYHRSGMESYSHIVRFIYIIVRNELITYQRSQMGFLHA
jgi:hypothetical protein